MVFRDSDFEKLLFFCNTAFAPKPKNLVNWFVLANGYRLGADVCNWHISAGCRPADLRPLSGNYLPLDAGSAAMRSRAAAPDAWHFRLKMTLNRHPQLMINDRSNKRSERYSNRDQLSLERLFRFDLFPALARIKGVNLLCFFCGFGPNVGVVDRSVMADHERHYA